MMTSFMRTIIELPDDQLEALADLCRREGISRAEAIRQAIAHFTRGRRSKAVAAAFGLWRNRPIDGLEYQRRLRDEWTGEAGRARRRQRRG
jgi:hypothetical protein